MIQFSLSLSVSTIPCHVLLAPASHLPVNQLFLELIEILLPLLADRLDEYVRCRNSVGELGIANISCTDGRMAASCLLLSVAADRSLLLSVGSERIGKISHN